MPSSGNAPSVWLRALLGNRLAHFLVLGAALFAVAPKQPDRHRIQVSTDQLVSAYAAQSRRSNGRPLAPSEKQEALDALIEEELLVREAIRLGLDRDDPVVRHRLVQRALSLADDLAGASAPVLEADLRAHAAQHPERWTTPPRARISQVFVASREHPDGATFVNGLRDRLRAGEAADISVAHGALASQGELASVLGRAVAEAAFQQEPDVWSDPIAATYGWYLVRVDERTDGGLPPFESVRAEVMADLVHERNGSSRAALLQRLSHEYSVEIESPAGERIAPSFRPTLRLDEAIDAPSRPSPSRRAVER